ncbi:MAG TPA: hypothetical protein VN673_06700, partial [Clostridia bacterium]|nr:hypothetical protein [Clostridia bacterium]
KPLLLVLLIEIVFMTAGRPEFHADEERNAWTMTWAAGMVMLVCDLVALYWVGMWQGLSARTYNRAAHGTVTRILVFPWILLALVMVLLVISSIGTGVEPGWKFFLTLWLVLGIGTDIGFSLIAREKLLNQFRSMAARRFEVPVTLWQRLLGR